MLDDCLPLRLLDHLWTELSWTLTFLQWSAHGWFSFLFLYPEVLVVLIDRSFNSCDLELTGSLGLQDLSLILESFDLCLKLLVLFFTLGHLRLVCFLGLKKLYGGKIIDITLPTAQTYRSQYFFPVVLLSISMVWVSFSRNISWYLVKFIKGSLPIEDVRNDHLVKQFNLLALCHDKNLKGYFICAILKR